MKQITILSQTSRDAIADVTKALAEENINIHSITADHYGQQSVIHLEVDDDTKATALLLRNQNWRVMREDALLAKVKDTVGILAQIAKCLDKAGAPLRSIRFVERHDGYALIALTAENRDLACNTLKKMEKDLSLIDIKEMGREQG